ncbi:hypothetical protein M3Y95_01201300 [Aphelenchoides besseyi]|nr:hypothetical protein M3Y95_01201300 [Aphelenchoides besseyi]
MKRILKFNSDILPTTSAFGTKNSTSICRRKRSCLPKLRNMYTQTRYARKYKTVACLIQKSLSTVLQAIMFVRRQIKPSNDFQILYGIERTCHESSEHTPQQRTEHRQQLASFGRCTGFVDKCIRKPYGNDYCNGCYSNITCFLITEHNRIQRQIKRRKFIRSFDDRHFFPQNWRCDFHWHFNQYKFIRYKSGVNGTNEFLDQLLPLLKQQGVGDESLKFIRDQLKSGQTVHSTVSSKARKFFEKRIRSSPFLMEYLVRIFYHDFKLFKFPIPQFQFKT